MRQKSGTRKSQGEKVVKDTLNHRHRAPVHPDIFPDQGAEMRDLIIIIFGDPVALQIMQRMNGLPGLRQPPHHLLAPGIVEVFGLHHAV